MYLNNNEEKIISSFLGNLDQYDAEEMKLSWKDGSFVVARFDTCFEDENDCDMDEEEYEEFWSFVFKAVDVAGEPPVYVTEDEYFCVSYHNFPDEILVGEEKIN